MIETLNEDDVRRIVREEIAEHERDLAAVAASSTDQHQAAVAEITAEKPGDGPLVRELKTILRG